MLHNKPHEWHRATREQFICFASKSMFYRNTLAPDENDCMLWVGKSNQQGYGIIYAKHRSIGAHRFSYLLHYGDIEKQMFVCHHCDNPSCVSPEHLFIGTAQENTNDSIRKNRHITQVRWNNGY